ESPLHLEAFSDSDYGGSNLDRKSTTGGCQFLGQRLISWQCKKQTIVATSITEAEYVATANCCGANLKNKKKFLMYLRFLQLILNIQTENKHPYLSVSLTKKIFRNMKRGFQGAPRPLLPSMLLVATDPITGQEHDAQAQTQPSPTPPPIPSPPPTPIPSPTPQPIPTPPLPPSPSPKSPPPPPPLETEPPTDEHIYEEHSPAHHYFSPSQAQAPSQMPTDDLLQTVPKLISRIDSLELDLRQTK
ncbi:putative ribonuclease H-like domain-containing protein, partial [Tanacetum coccineum]